MRKRPTHAATSRVSTRGWVTLWSGGPGVFAATREALDRTGQSLLGKYELTRMLGKGGMGEVWEGEHSLTGRRVAVKVLADSYLANKKVVARFGREARAASSVNHPGIVEILDQDRTPDGVPFLVMEFLEGESVGERIRKRGKLPQDDVLAIMLPLLDALDAAHHAGVIHRDLKPDNVYILPGLRGEERIKILDFGISQKSDEIEQRLTQEGSVLGTPHYMSPEQAKGEGTIDGRVDVYAAGVMFYECVVGDVPFDAGNYNALLQIILSTPPPSPRSKGADISPAVEQVLLAAMDKQRQRRPPTARAFHDLLLEAGMQEDDAMLDVDTWSFTTPSEPPPPVDFGDMSDAEFDSEPMPVVVPAARARGGAGDSFRDFDLPQAAPARRMVPAPPPKSSFSPPNMLDDALSDAPARPQQYDSLSPPESRRAPAPRAGFGAPSLRPFDPGPMPRAPFDPGPAVRAPFDAAPAPAARGVVIAAAPRINQSQAASAERVRPERRAQASNSSFQLNPAPAEQTLGRTVLNWVVTLVALGALVYLMQIVFTRPDARKPKKPTEAGAPSEQSAQPTAAP